MERVRTILVRWCSRKERKKKCGARLWLSQRGLWQADLIGREDRVWRRWRVWDWARPTDRDPQCPPCPGPTPNYTDFLYERLQRQDFCARLPADVSIRTATCSAACMVATGDADAMVTGLTRSTSVLPGGCAAGDWAAPGRYRIRSDIDARAARRTIFVADSLVHFRPDAEHWRILSSVPRRPRG